jgi:cyanobactin maturation PatA/PatG family protease
MSDIPSAAGLKTGSAARAAPSADCGYGGTGGVAAQMVYALGKISYDFVSESRRDSFRQHYGINPNDAGAVSNLLEQTPSAASDMTWTLNLDDTPIYVIRPSDTFAEPIYARLAAFLRQQLNDEVERVSIPGIEQRTTSLNGAILPVLAPTLRDMFAWTTKSLIAAARAQNRDTPAVEFENFLARIYFQTRNMGRSSDERAINYAATHAFQAPNLFRTAMADDWKLERIEAETSVFCRPDSDCRDVKLFFFKANPAGAPSRRVYGFTIDVSDVVPAIVGNVRTWVAA